MEVLKVNGARNPNERSTYPEAVSLKEKSDRGLQQERSVYKSIEEFVSKPK